MENDGTNKTSDKAVRVYKLINERAGDRERLMDVVSRIVDVAIEEGTFKSLAGTGNWDSWVWERRGLLCHYIFNLAHDEYQLRLAKEKTK